MGRVIRSITALGFVFALVGVGSATAGASLVPNHDVCSGSGKLIVSDFGLPGPTRWDLTGDGFCGRVNLPVEGLETVTLSGSGTSDTIGLGVLGIGEIGLCTNTLLVTNFTMAVRAEFEPVAVAPAAHVTDEVWWSPLTTFPVVMPLVVSKASDASTPAGASVLLSHIVLQCGNDGTRPSLQFDWAQLF